MLSKQLEQELEWMRKPTMEKTVAKAMVKDMLADLRNRIGTYWRAEDCNEHNFRQWHKVDSHQDDCGNGGGVPKCHPFLTPNI